MKNHNLLNSTSNESINHSNLNLQSDDLLTFTHNDGENLNSNNNIIHNTLNVSNNKNKKHKSITNGNDSENGNSIKKKQKSTRKAVNLSGYILVENN